MNHAAGKPPAKPRARRRANVRLAVCLGLLALAFYAFMFLLFGTAGS